MKKQFDKDKQSAIDEGYTEEQAIQFANQEQQLRNNKSKAQETKKSAAKKPKNGGRQKDVTLVADQDTVATPEAAEEAIPGPGINKVIPQNTQNSEKNVENQKEQAPA